MATLSKDEVNQIMMDVPEYFRYRWCGGGPCGCMGCANFAGKAAFKGLSREEWEQWVADNPNPNPPKRYDPEQLWEALRNS